MLVSYELHAAVAQGLSMQSLGVVPARLLNRRTVWVRVCVCCAIHLFSTTAFWVLLCVMEARVVCVRCSTYI